MRLIRYMLFVALVASLSSAGIVGLTKDITAIHTQGHDITQVYANGVVWSAGGAAFSPLDIADCELWTDLSDASTVYDAVSGGSLVANGGRIASVVNKADITKRAYMARGSSGQWPLYRTGYTNGLNAAEITVYGLAHTNTFTTSTEFLVYKTTSRDYVVLLSGNSASYCMIAQSGSTSTSTGAGCGTPAYYKNGTVQAWTTRGDIYTATASQMLLLSVSGVTYSSWATPISSLDYQSSWAYSTGSFMMEHLIYDRVLSDTERAQVEAYLIAKWGL